MLEKWDFVSINQSKQIISKAFIRYSMAKNLPKKPQVFVIFLPAGRHAFGGMILTIGLALLAALQQDGKIRAAPAAHIQHIGALRQRQMGHGQSDRRLCPLFMPNSITSPQKP